MRIEEDLKLGSATFLSVLKRSTPQSRSDVELERQFTPLNTQVRPVWRTRLLAANMDSHRRTRLKWRKHWPGLDILTAVHKHYTVEEWAALSTRLRLMFSSM